MRVLDPWVRFLIYFKKRFLYDIQINFSSRVFSNYLNQSYDFFLKNNKPQIMRNLGILAEYIIVLENFINIAIEGLILMLILSIIYYSNFYVGLTITVFSLIFVYVILKIFKDRFKKYGENDTRSFRYDPLAKVNSHKNITFI